MSDWRPFQLLSKARLAQVAERVNACLPDLAAGWWSGVCPIQLAAISAWDGASTGAPVRFLLRDGDAWLALVGADHAWLKLTESWLGCSLPIASPLVRTLQRAFCVDLYSKLTQRESPALRVLSSEEAPTLPPQTPGAGVLMIELDTEGVPLTLVAPIDLWPTLAEPAVRLVRKPLSEVAGALKQSRIRLDVRLPAVRWPMADIATLAAGDFLDLRHDLSGRVRVVAEDVDVTLDAELGQEDGQKVIRVLKDQSTS